MENTENIQKHRGSVVESTVRQSGFSFKKLAERLSISRNTLYNRFKDPALSYDFIRAVGKIIHYNFAPDFPEFQEQVDAVRERSLNYVDQDTVGLLRLEKKYTTLLERYNKLLGILVRLANTNELQTVRKEVFRFLDENSL